MKNQWKYSIMPIIITFSIILSSIGPCGRDTFFGENAAVFAAERTQASMIADPPTAYFADYFAPSTIYNGHIWVDKTVNEHSMTFYDHQSQPIYTIGTKPDEFLVTLSALSQSYSVETISEPTDTVFVIDVSGSMYSNQMSTGSGGLSTRANVMVSSLNEAMRTIIDANPASRVAVVAYGGYASGSTDVSRTVQMLPLGHYDWAGDYFTISGNQISANSAWVGRPSIPTVTVEGGTPTQRGIREGARILAENGDTQYSYVTEKGRSITVTRRPCMILLTDGEPTFAWQDYTAANATDTNFNCGNGSVAGVDMGMDLLTVLTASYWKQKVQDHYYGAASSAAPASEMQIYTIGMGVSGVHATSVMDPARNAAFNSITFGGSTYNMGALLDQFINPSVNSITFPAMNKGVSNARSLITVGGNAGYIKGYNYTNGYYPADNRAQLSDAFRNIAREIISKGNYTTEHDQARPNFSGYITLSDVVGEHMKFGDYKGTWVAGRLHEGRIIAQQLTTQPEGGPAWTSLIDALSTQLKYPRSTVRDIIASNIASGDTYYNSDSDFRIRIRWYENFDESFAGLYYSLGGQPLPPPPDAAVSVEMYTMADEVYNEAAGEHTSLMYLYFAAHTALKPGNFNIRRHSHLTVPLVRGQQCITWHVPASLIPLRTVSETPDGEGLATAPEIKEAYPICVSYTIAMDENFEPAQMSPEYKNNNRTTDNKGYYFYTNAFGAAPAATLALFRPNRNNPYYYFTEDTPLYVRDAAGYIPAADDSPGSDYYILDRYFDARLPGYIGEEYTLVDKGVTRIAVAPNGTPYIPSGERRKSRTVSTYKTNNLTGTNDFKMEVSSIDDVDVYQLGNNGRVEIRGLTDVSVKKNWKGTPTPIWVQLYANGIPCREPVELNGNNGWRHTWQELLSYGVTADAEGNNPFIRYTVAEGTYENGVFTPYPPAKKETAPSLPAGDEPTEAPEAAPLEEDEPVKTSEFTSLLNEDEPTDTPEDGSLPGIEELIETPVAKEAYRNRVFASNSLSAEEETLPLPGTDVPADMADAAPQSGGPIEMPATEGTVENGVFMLYSLSEEEAAAYEGDGFKVFYTQPQWDEIMGTWSEAEIHNVEPGSELTEGPEPTESGPTEPEPTEFGPTEPGPTEPGHTEPEPTEPPEVIPATSTPEVIKPTEAIPVPGKPESAETPSVPVTAAPQATAAAIPIPHFAGGNEDGFLPNSTSITLVDLDDVPKGAPIIDIPEDDEIVTIDLPELPGSAVVLPEPSESATPPEPSELSAPLNPGKPDKNNPKTGDNFNTSLLFIMIVLEAVLMFWRKLGCK